MCIPCASFVGGKVLHAFALGLLLLFFFPLLDKTVFFGVDSCTHELTVKTGDDTQRLRR